MKQKDSMKISLQVAAGILIAVVVIVAAHEIWAYRQFSYVMRITARHEWRTEKNLAELSAEKNGEKFDMSSIESVDSRYSRMMMYDNKYSWFIE